MIRNAKREPDIANLVCCLMAMGAWAAGLDGNVLTIEGGSLLTGAVHTVTPGRIELDTIAYAAAVTVMVSGCAC